MSTLTFNHPRATMRTEFFRMITLLVSIGRTNTTLKRTRMPDRDIARAIKIPEKMVQQTIKLHELFVSSFGRKPLIDAEGNVVLDPSMVTQFLSKPSIIPLVSDISGMSEASILRILDPT